ncbi:hypothetical protein, partial [Paenibacillus sp. 2TAB19]|uniref:hypothetical protein n=1 Tax=Paenibacillus sp. 2TAB19 TaxID=3233003 RepID=UPI003F96361D
MAYLNFGGSGTMLYKFINYIKAKPIDDINLIGFINLEDDGVYEFTPMLTFVYFQYGEEYIEFESINQYSKLKVSFVQSLPSIRHKYDTVEDFFPAKSSISDIVLIHPSA